MAQAGIHGLASTIVSKITPKKEYLLLGIVFGNVFPDADNLAVAIATLTGWSTEGLHRTFTHSLIVIVALVVLFYLIGQLFKKPSFGNFGFGLGIGMLMHVLLDLVIWFNGVELLWPLKSWVNLWSGITPADWWNSLMMPAEFLFFGLFFLWMQKTAQKQGTDTATSGKLKIHIIIQMILFVVFSVLVFTMKSGFMTICGAVYLIVLGITFYFVFKMKNTIEATSMAK